MRYGRILTKTAWYSPAKIPVWKSLSWVNDPTSAINLQLNELIEHIASFALNYKIKHDEDNALIEHVDEYLDDTFMLFSNYGISAQDLQKWRKSGNRLFRCFVNVSKANPVSLSF